MMIVVVSMNSLTIDSTLSTGGLLFKAQPILIKDPYPAKTTTTTPVQCTTPFSPNLRTKARSMLKSNVDSVMNSSGSGSVVNQNGRDITTTHHHASSTKHITKTIGTTITTTSTNRSILDATSHHSKVLANAIQML